VWATALVVVAALVVGLALWATRPLHGSARRAPATSEASLPPAAPSGFEPTIPNAVRPPGPAPAGMVWIPGGEFSMGSRVESESFCSMPGVTRDALPVHRVYVDGFWMDATEVTNEDFAKFVKATGYATVAERIPTKEEYPGAPPENLVAGSVASPRPRNHSL
jgi:formylglycine-generating enzyme required for sulfatase activity